MRYSIIIPIYNAEKTLARCLDSILRQPFSDYELLLINDGSGDGSGEICAAYARRYPQIRYFPKENGGVSSARNLGLEQARGEYILFVDSDDYVADNYFAVIDAAVAQKRPDLLSFGYQNFGANTSAWNTGRYTETDALAIAQRVDAAMRGYLFSSLLCRAFRREVITTAGLRFRENLSIGEDQLFLFSYVLQCRSLVSIPDLLYCVDVSDQNSLSRKRRDHLTQQLLQVNREMACALEQAALSDDARAVYRGALAWMTYRSAYSCFKELLKYDIATVQRRREIREICKLYCAESVKPIGWRCRLIALPVQLRMSGVIDALIKNKARR